VRVKYAALEVARPLWNKELNKHRKHVPLTYLQFQIQVYILVDRALVSRGNMRA